WRRLAPFSSRYAAACLGWSGRVLPPSSRYGEEKERREDRNTDGAQPDQHQQYSAIGLKYLIVVGPLRWGLSGRHGLRWKLRNNLRDGGIRSEPHSVRERPDESTAVDSGWQPRDVIGFKCLEQGNRDLRRIRNLRKRDSLTLASIVKLGTQIRIRRRFRCRA